jgi:predicted secreted protein
MTTNPYAPPEHGAVFAAPAQKSIARRVSFVLAAIGFVGFWSAMILIGSQVDQDLPEDSPSAIAAGLVMLLAGAVHLVGIGVVFAAPRGRRWPPALLNGVSLAIMVAVLLYGLSTGAD